uniref:Uncharacterized protein n=1 Tax=Mycena chlorophos TaxID=658473 RepID=A0ABQ0LQ51_MYCCL|nr:predicted protein [Mycena chlorophos]
MEFPSSLRVYSDSDPLLAKITLLGREDDGLRSCPCTRQATSRISSVSAPYHGCYAGRALDPWIPDTISPKPAFTDLQPRRRMGGAVRAGLFWRVRTRGCAHTPFSDHLPVASLRGLLHGPPAALRPVLLFGEREDFVAANACRRGLSAERSNGEFCLEFCHPEAATATPISSSGNPAGAFAAQQASINNPRIPSRWISRVIERIPLALLGAALYAQTRPRPSTTGSLSSARHVTHPRHMRPPPKSTYLGNLAVPWRIPAVRVSRHLGARRGDGVVCRRSSRPFVVPRLSWTPIFLMRIPPKSARRIRIWRLNGGACSVTSSQHSTLCLRCPRILQTMLFFLLSLTVAYLRTLPRLVISSVAVIDGVSRRLLPAMDARGPWAVPFGRTLAVGHALASIAHDTKARAVGVDILSPCIFFHGLCTSSTALLFSIYPASTNSLSLSHPLSSRPSSLRCFQISVCTNFHLALIVEPSQVPELCTSSIRGNARVRKAANSRAFADVPRRERRKSISQRTPTRDNTRGSQATPPASDVESSARLHIG